MTTPAHRKLRESLRVMREAILREPMEGKTYAERIQMLNLMEKADEIRAAYGWPNWDEELEG